MSWIAFKKQFPDADFDKFKEVNGNVIFEPTGEVLYLKGVLQNEAVMDIITYKPEAWSEKYLLTNQHYPNPAVSFSVRLNGDLTLKIRVSEEKRFKAKIRDVFKEVPVTHTTVKESKEWLAGPNMRYWPQQLNFAVWCARSGCGVGMDLMKDPFFMFHFHFTLRRILYEMSTPLPGNKPFNAKDNSYDKAAYERIKKEFNIAGDFRFTHNYEIMLGEAEIIEDPWHEANEHAAGWLMGGIGHDRGDLIKTPKKKPKESKIRFKNKEAATQYLNFIPPVSKGLTRRGLARVNRSIEALVYCVLGAQVNTRSSIIGDSGSAEETRQQFQVLFESAVIENDISKGIQRYQMAIQNAKARLDYAVAPGCWLMPSNMVINTHSVVGYNNKLQRATQDMRPGVNEINQDTTGGVPHVETKKVHPAPEHKQPVPKPKKVHVPKEKPNTYDHDLLKGGLILASAGLAFYIWR